MSWIVIGLWLPMLALAIDQPEPDEANPLFPPATMPTVLSNSAQLATALDEFEWQYPHGIYPWEPGWFEPAAVWWTDFASAGPPLTQYQQTDSQAHWGVPMWPVWVTLWPSTGQQELRHPWNPAVSWPLAPLELKLGARLWKELLKDLVQLGGPSPTNSVLAADQELPRAVLNVWLADVRHRELFEKRLLEATAQWLEQEAAAAAQARTALITESFLPLAGGSQTMLMQEGGTDPCDSTNAPPRVEFTLIVTASNVVARAEFPTCSTHLYQLQSSTNMLDWAAVMTLVGENTVNVWEQPANEPRRFYRLFRMAFDDDQDGDGLSNLAEFNTHGTDPGNPDTDGDGMPDGWELQYGFDPLNPADGSGDYDGDGVSNSLEYVQGRDPTKPAVPDLNHDVNLIVFSPME